MTCDDTPLKTDDTTLNKRDPPPTSEDDEIPPTQPSSLLDRVCVYARGGVCKKHGDGARSMWKPLEKMEKVGAGNLVRRMGRKYYFVCDLGMRDRGKLRQSRLSFRKNIRPEDKPGGGDDTLGRE